MVTRLLCLTIFCASLSGCDRVRADPEIKPPASLFEEEPEYQGELGLMGQLAEGYVHNTLALRRANNKLKTLCRIEEVCAEAQLESGDAR